MFKMMIDWWWNLLGVKEPEKIETPPVVEKPAPKAKAKPKPKAKKAPAPKAEAVDMSKMTKAQLIAHAKEKGVKVDPKAKKADIIAQLS